MTPPPNHTAPENAPAAAAEDNHFDGDGPRGDDRPAPLAGVYCESSGTKN